MSLDRTIAFDFMAGSHEPKEAYVAGCLATCRAVDELDCNLILTVPQDRFQNAEFDLSDLIKDGRIALHKSFYLIDHGTNPITAFKERNNNTTTDAVRLIQTGKANAVVSPGNTGLYAHSISKLGLQGLDGLRFFPLVAKVPAKVEKDRMFPYGADLGASSAANDRDLVKYAILLDSFLCMKGIPYPRIGLLTIGKEAGKGSSADKRAGEHLENWNRINFVGNVEPKHIKEGNVDGFVCDGKTGNVFLKTIEAYTPLVVELTPWILPARTFLGLSSRVRRVFDKSNYDGAIFLGYDVPIIKAHGNSSTNELFYALRTADEYCQLRGALDLARQKLENFNEYLGDRPK